VKPGMTETVMESAAKLMIKDLRSVFILVSRLVVPTYYREF
jgi:hypothetical protein